MPISVKEMARRSKREVERMVIESEQFNLEHGLQKHGPRKNTRMFGILKEIFDQWAPVPAKVTKLPAVDFHHLYEKYSPPTIVKAKRMLGVKSTRKDGLWFWGRPKRTPEEALSDRYLADLGDLDEAKKEIRRINSRVCKVLMELMVTSGYIALNKDILKEMDIRGYGRISTLRAKSTLGIATRKIDGEWMWLTYDEAVVKWLEKQLDNGPVLVRDLMARAWEDKQWHREVVKMARESVGTIRWTMNENKLYWFNSSDVSSLPPAQPAREPVRTVQRGGYVIKDYMPERMVRVDFTDAPSMVNIKVSDEEQVTVKKSSVSAGKGLPNILVYEEEK